jgi:hypothetical protein
MRHTPERFDSATSFASQGGMKPWRGHFPITSVVMLSILNRVVAGPKEFSRVERVFYLACEFWAAVNARELAAHLDPDAADPLHDARLAFSAIGAARIVAVLRHADVAAGTRAKGGRRQRIAALEERLLRTPDSVDVLIREFARRYLCDDLGLPVPAPGAPSGVATDSRTPEVPWALRGQADCET